MFSPTTFSVFYRRHKPILYIMGSSDGGFERELVNEINDLAEDSKVDFYAHRKKQHRFTSQECDVLVDSANNYYYLGIEAKTKKIDYEKANKDNNSVEGKLYFSQHFSTNKDDVHQVESMQDFIEKSGRKGILAIAYRRGRGKSVLKYALPWAKVWEKFQDDDASGITKEFVEENGVEISDDFSKIFDATKN